MGSMHNSDGSGVEKVGFGYTQILKSRVWAGNEILGIRYFWVKTSKALVDFTNKWCVEYGKSWVRAVSDVPDYTRLFISPYFSVLHALIRKLHDYWFLSSNLDFFQIFSVRPNPLFLGSAETETEPGKITETEPNPNRTCANIFCHINFYWEKNRFRSLSKQSLQNYAMFLTAILAK